MDDSICVIMIKLIRLLYNYTRYPYGYYFVEKTLIFKNR